MAISTFQGTLARELLDAVHFLACSLGTSAAPHSHSLQLANHTQLAYSLHSISFMHSFTSFSSPRGFLQTTVWKWTVSVWSCIQVSLLQKEQLGETCNSHAEIRCCHTFGAQAALQIPQHLFTMATGGHYITMLLADCITMSSPSSFQDAMNPTNAKALQASQHHT